MLDRRRMLLLSLLLVVSKMGGCLDRVNRRALLRQANEQKKAPLQPPPKSPRQEPQQQPASEELEPEPEPAPLHQLSESAFLV